MHRNANFPKNFVAFQLSTRPIPLLEADVDVSEVEACPLLEWTIEFGKHLNGGPSSSTSEKQILCLKMNGHDERFQTVASGPVVDITTGRSKMINVIVENVERQKWFRIELPLQFFSPLMNVNWFARGEISVLSMGFFPEHITAEKIKKCEVSIFPMELVQGFRYVRKYMGTGTIDVHSPLTWTASEKPNFG
jgi:hypothetical protein